MPILRITNAAGTCTGIVTYSLAYEYMGFRFENHSLMGPTKINKTGEQSAANGRKFWAAYAAWDKLSPAEKEATRL